MQLNEPDLHAVYYFCSYSYQASDQLEPIMGAIESGMQGLNYTQRIHSPISNVDQQWCIYPFADRSHFSTHPMGVLCVKKGTENHKNIMIISFHGTRPSSFIRFFKDLRITLTSFNHTSADKVIDELSEEISEIKETDDIGHIHTGYINSIRNAIPAFITQVRSVFENLNLDISRTEFIFTGHSMGGALATMASVFFSKSQELFGSHGALMNQVKSIVVNPAGVGDENFHQFMYESMGRMNIVCFKHQEDWVIGTFHRIVNFFAIKYENEFGFIIPYASEIRGAGPLGHSVPEYDEFLSLYQTSSNMLQTMPVTEDLYNAGHMAYQKIILKKRKGDKK